MPSYTELCVISTPGARGGGGLGNGGGVGNLLLLDLFFFDVGGKGRCALVSSRYIAINRLDCKAHCESVWLLV